ncbi:hypothetical protein GW750_06915 [bacterium]|nr:hypothetical protein [bacterium]
MRRKNKHVQNARDSCTSLNTWTNQKTQNKTFFCCKQKYPKISTRREKERTQQKRIVVTKN